MVYKKYIEKDGKTYGPYIYSSKRVDGKVISEYHGVKEKKDNKKFLFIGAGILVLLVLIFFIFFFQSKISSNVILDISGDYVQGEIVNGALIINLKQGELIPDSSKIIIKNNDKIYEYNLKDLVEEELINGSYYVQGNSISGQGEGYGITGIKKSYPNIYFKLKIYSDKSNESGFGDSEISDDEIIDNTEEIIDENITEETVDENITEEIIEENITNEIIDNTEEIIEETIVDENSNLEDEVSQEGVKNIQSDNLNEETSESSSEEVVTSESSETVQEFANEETSESSSSPITGAVVGGFFSKIFNPTGRVSSISEKEIQGDVSYDSGFKYSLSDGENVKIIEGSVKTDTKELSSSDLKLEKQGNEIIVTTNYYESEQGFGEDYVGEEIKELNINLSDLNIDFKEGNLKVSLFSSDKEIISLEIPLEENSSFLDDEIINDTEIDLEDLNVTLNETFYNETNITNETLINVFALSNISLTESEKEILNENFPNSSVLSERSSYKNWILVEFHLGNNNIQYSYDSSLNATILENLIEIDRINWLKDVVNSLSYEEEVPVSLENSSKEYKI